MSGFERALRARHVLRSLRAWRRRLLAFGGLAVVLFAVVGLLQHQYVHSSFSRSVDSELADWASEVAAEVAYKDRWNLADYRERASVFAPRWWIIANDGLVVDITGLTPNVFKHVQLVGGSRLGSPTTVTTSIGESWRILGKGLDDGVAVVGIASPTDLTQADAKLASTLDKFGMSLAEATAVRERQTDQEVDFAVIDTGGALLSASGGVPLIVNLGDLPVALDTGSVATMNEGDRSYRLLSLPIRGTAGRAVGAVVVPKDITGELQALADQDRFNILLVVGSLALLLLLALSFAVRELSRHREAPTVEEALKVGESKTVEFKSTYRWDPDQGKENPENRLKIVKAIAGFLNADGGYLYIGIEENRVSGRPRVCGLRQDLEIVKGDVDKLRRDLTQFVVARLGDEFSPCITERVEEVQGELCLIVTVQRAPGPAFVEWHESTTFFVREGPRTAPLDVAAATRYIKNRWG